MNYVNYSNFNKQSNYSYPNASHFIATNNIPIYVNGVLVAGFSPISENNPGESDSLPLARPYVLPDSAFIAIEKNQKVKLSWVPVKGAKSYVVSIYNKKDKSLITRQTTPENSIQLDLGMGAYLWRVESFADINSSEGQTSLKGDEKSNIIYVIELDKIALSEGMILGVTPLAARKDTKLIDPIWGNLAIEKEWNSEHISHTEYDEEESYRCWAVAANTLDRYYGGTLSQDEIKILGMKELYLSEGETLPPYFYFMHGKGGGLNDEILFKILRHIFGEDPVMKDGMPSLDVLRESFQNLVKPNPIIVSIFWYEEENGKKVRSGHDMVVDGYAVLDKGIQFNDGTVFNKGSVFYHYLNQDNNGTSLWISSNSFNYDHYFIAKERSKVGRRDYRIDIDSDGDGIMDYDEIERFGTNPNRIDSDDDGIKDLDEIYLFVKRCEVTDPSKGCLDISYADPDMDGLLPPLDWDSDNGGEDDGSEIDAGKDILNKDDDLEIIYPDIVWDLPSDITIYSLDAMRVNDRTICYDGDGYCKIASESSEIDFAINIGVQAIVGDVYSRGGVVLRSLAEVRGDIYTYFDGGNASSITTQAGSSVTGLEKRHYFNNWLFKDVWKEEKYRLPSDIGSASVLNVAAGHEALLSNGDVYSAIKVESGATLYIGPGAIVTGKLQLESGSTIVFTNPGQETILYMEGSMIWRTTIANEDKELVAKGFKLIQLANQRMNIEGDWAGTIHAARSPLVMGQTKKMMYGRFLAKSVTMHQQSRIYRVDFAPINPYANVALK